MLLEAVVETSLVEGVKGIFSVLLEGVKFIVKDVFIDVIVLQVFTEPITWVGAAIGVGLMLLCRLKKPLN